MYVPKHHEESDPAVLHALMRPGKAVPTWNYAVVHAHGMPRAIDDRDWLLRHVTRLSDVHEAGQALPWRVSDAPTEFVERMLASVVGIEIPIARLVGRSVPPRSV